MNLQSQIQGVSSSVVEKNPYLVLIGFILGILLLDYFFIFQFQLKTLMSINPKIENLSEDLKTTKNNIERLPQYQKEIESLKRRLEYVQSKIKSGEEVPLILENISRMANKHGVKIVQIMQDKASERSLGKTKDGEYFSVPIIVEASSGYHNFGQFLNQLEAEGLFIEIPQFTITASGGGLAPEAIKLFANVITLMEQKR